ncbi:ABC transporter permease subunit [Bacillus sp. JJ722]|uniref:ABC transporter permease subunit n=1 Tax=Bacillus sp. JJ722 TaxID=3122973 RepID=UPI002FFE7D47
MSLLFHEWKVNFKSLCLWLIGMMVLIGISVAKSIGMTNDSGQSMTELLEQTPKSMQALFGVGLVDFSNITGIFSVIFLYIAVIAAFHASSLGTSIFSKEERDKTFEFLYVKGMKRSQILSQKLLVCMINMFLLNAVTFMYSVLLVKLIDKTNIAYDLLPMMAGLLFIQLLFFSIGLLISFFTKRTKLAGNISFGVVMACLFMSIFADLSEKADFLRYFTPFKYFEGKTILHEGLDVKYMWLCIGVSILCISVSFKLHNMRDLKS